MALISSINQQQADELIQPIDQEFLGQGKPVPEWVKVMAHCPHILKEFYSLFKAIMAEGCLEKDLKWKIAYVVSQTLKCKFCIDVTEKMLKKFGASDKILNEIKKLQSSSQEEVEILALVKDATLDGYLDHPEIFDKLKNKLSEAQLVEVVSVIGLFNYINRFNNIFAILPE